MATKQPIDLSQMNRAAFAALDHGQLLEVTCRLHTLAVEMAERLALNSSNSSRPPSSDTPFGGGGAVAGLVGAGSSVGAVKTAAAAPPANDQKPLRDSPPSEPGPKRKPGKQPGAQGKCRDEPLKPERSQSLWPTVCGGCGRPFEASDKEVRTGAAFAVLELERTAGGIRIVCVEHRYQVLLCPCGHETEAKSGVGALSFLDGGGRGSSI